MNTRKALSKLFGKGTKRSNPGPSRAGRQRSRRTFRYFKKLWIGLFLTVPLDLVVAPFIFGSLQTVLSMASLQLRYAILSLSFLCMLVPLAKNFVIELALGSQGLQREAQGLKIQFQSLLSALFGVVILADVARRVATFGIEYAIGVAALGLIVFPAWYRTLKTNQIDLPPPVNDWDETRTTVARSVKQFELVYTLLLLIGRAAIFTTIGLASVWNYSMAYQILIAFAGALVLFSETPSPEDLFRICRKCGLWSHRAHQIDGFCPGCAGLALKSMRFLKRKSRLSKVRSTLEKLDKGIEGLKLPQKKP